MSQRTIATEKNVERLFSKITVPYPVPTDEGSINVDMPAWKCRSCGWESLMFLNGLPLPHCCDDIRSINGITAKANAPVADVQY